MWNKFLFSDSFCFLIHELFADFSRYFLIFPILLYSMKCIVMCTQYTFVQGNWTSSLSSTIVPVKLKTVSVFKWYIYTEFNDYRYQHCLKGSRIKKNIKRTIVIIFSSKKLTEHITGCPQSLQGLSHSLNHWCFQRV